ncbi:MAG: YraN family protein [Clostridiales bacterium]|nr:YraN family protein [Clostridiales bacterium]
MNKKIGAYGEEVSEKFLIDKGYKILHTNYKTKIGEIDIIAKKDNVICYIEVKTRRSTKFGMPCEAVNYKKQKIYRMVASRYVKHYANKTVDFRFDVIEVVLKYKKCYLRHLENAF